MIEGAANKIASHQPPATGAEGCGSRSRAYALTGDYPAAHLAEALAG